MIVDSGLELVRDFLAGISTDPPDSGAYGTDGTPENQNDTSLKSEVSATRLGFVSTFSSDLEARLEHFLDASTGNGNIFREFGLIRNADSKLFSRQTFTDIEKDTSIELQRITIIRIGRG